MERYRDMQLFVALAGQPSLAAAARSARVSGATLVRAVARLEARLRVSLLLRSTQGVSLTDAGRAYLADCVRLLAAVDVAEASALGLQVQAQGHVRVFLPVLFSRYVMAPILADYMDRHPDVRLTVRYHDYYPNLHEEGLDVAILVGELPNSSLIARPVGQVRSILCASPGYLAQWGMPQAPQDLLRHQCLHFSHLTDGTNWHFQRGEGDEREEVSVRVQAGFTANNGLVLHQAAQRGLGIVYSTTFLAWRNLLDGSLQSVLSDWDLPLNHLSALYPASRQMSPKVRALIDFLVAEYQPVPPWDRELAAAGLCS